MPNADHENTGGNGTEVLCRNCGRALTEFLHKMEEHNAEVVCPHCGKKHEVGNPSATRPPGKDSKGHQRSRTVESNAPKLLALPIRFALRAP